MSTSDDQMTFDLSPYPLVDTSFLSNTQNINVEEVYTNQNIVSISYTKGDVFRQINSQLILNEFGIPDYIYRADRIPASLYDMSPIDRHNTIESAIIPISWDFGYPAASFDEHGSITNISPIWECLPGESPEAFTAFMQYLELPQNSDSQNPVRMLPLLSQALNIPYKQLQEYAHIYYWTIRFRAYDLFLIACHQKQKEQRIMSIEGRHYKAADTYLQKIDIILNTKLDHTINELADPDSSIHDELKLKDLVDIIDKLNRIQRVSVGLSANGVDNSEGANIGRRNQTIDDSFKEIASYASSNKKGNQRSADMDALLANPEDLAKAQDLITKNLR